MADWRWKTVATLGWALLGVQSTPLVWQSDVLLGLGTAAAFIVAICWVWLRDEPA